MELHQVLAAALIGASGGFGLYCLSCALHVWRTRNRNRRAPGADDFPAARWGRTAAAVSFFGGMVCVALAVAVELAVGSEGLLHGEGLFTVRPPKDLYVEWTTAKSSVAAGEVVARFRSPQLEAEIEVLGLQLDELRANRVALAKRPLEPDAEITRQLLESGSERRHLQAARDDLEIEKRGLQRELSRERLAKELEINRLAVELAQLDRELEQAASALDFNERQLHRSVELLQSKATSQHDHEQCARDAKLARDEVDKLRERAAKTAVQKADLEKGLAELVETMQSQSAALAEKLDALADRFNMVAAAEKSLNQRLEADLARAAELRERELEQIDIQRRQAEGKLKGLRDTLQEAAPFSGHVVYRAPSPRTAKEEEPLLVLGGPKALRLRLRVPTWHRAGLQEAAAVKLELRSPRTDDGQREKHFVERRFSGSFGGWQALPDDPWYGLAELACAPPPEAVWHLACGGDVLVRLCWWPSLFSNPGFRLGLILALVGAAGWTFTAAGRVIAAPPTATPSAVGAGEVGTEGGLPAEYGAEGAMLHLLGSQLREAILRGKIDRHLIAAAEWALDRHRARAIRCIAAGLQTADGLCGPLEQLIGACRSAPSHGGNGAPSRAELRRFLRVVQAVAGEELQAEIKRLLREWDASASPERGSRTASLLHSRPR